MVCFVVNDQVFFPGMNGAFSQNVQDIFQNFVIFLHDEDSVAVIVWRRCFQYIVLNIVACIEVLLTTWTISTSVPCMN